MAEMFQSSWATLSNPIPVGNEAGVAIVQRYTIAITGTQLETINNIFEVAPIPPGMRVADMVLDTYDMDDGTDLTLSVGIMSGLWGVDDDARTCGAEFFSASTVGQAGGVVRPTLATAFQTSPTQTERSIGVKVAAAAGSAAGNTGTLGLTVTYVAP